MGKVSGLVESVPLIGVAAKIVQGAISVVKAAKQKMDAVRAAASIVVGIIELLAAIADIAQQLPSDRKRALDPKLNDINLALNVLSNELKAYVTSPKGVMGFLIATVVSAMSTKSTVLITAVDNLKKQTAELQTYATTIATGVMLKKLNSMGEERVKACMGQVEGRVQRSGLRGDEAERAIAGNAEALQALASELKLSEASFRAEVEALGAALGLKLDQLDATTRAYGDMILASTARLEGKTTEVLATTSRIEANQERDKAEIIAAVKGAVSGAAVDPELRAFLSKVGVGDYASVLVNAGATDLEKLKKLSGAAFFENLGMDRLLALRLEEAVKNPGLYSDRPSDLSPSSLVRQLSMKDQDQWPELLKSKLSNPKMALSPDQSLEFLGHCINLGQVPAKEAAAENLVVVIGNTGNFYIT